MSHNGIGAGDADKMNRLYLYRPFVNAALVNGNFKTIVMLPKFVSVNEWVAINSMFGLHLSLCSGLTRCPPPCTWWPGHVLDRLDLN